MKVTYNTEEIAVRSRLAVIPLRDVVVFPHMIYPLLVGRSFTVKALQEAMMQDKQVLLVAQRSAATDTPNQDDLYMVGVVARILQVMKMPNGTLKVLVEGMVRAKVRSLTSEGEFLVAQIDLVRRADEKYDRETEALSRAVTEQFTEYVRLNRRIPDEVLASVASIEVYDLQADTISSHLLHKIETKQKLLEAGSVKEQLLQLSEVLKEELEILKIEHKIDGSIRESMSRNQREVYLQQQLKAIKDELGQGEDGGADVDDLYGRLDTGDYPEAVVAKADEEIRKLSKMHPYSAEAGVVR
jgi:ATP-dependent Lon protease